jgi:hypothetical protein
MLGAGELCAGACGANGATARAGGPKAAISTFPVDPTPAGAVGLRAAAALVLTGSQNGSGSGVSSEVGGGAVAAAAKRLKNAWLDAAPDGS